MRAYSTNKTSVNLSHAWRQVCRRCKQLIDEADDDQLAKGQVQAMLLEADKEHQREKAKLRRQIEELSLALAKQQHGAEARTAASRAAAAHQRATKAAGGYGAGVASWGSGNEPAGATDAGGGSRFWNAGCVSISSVMRAYQL